MRFTPLSTGFHLADKWQDRIKLDKPPFLNTLALSFNNDLSPRWRYSIALHHSWINVSDAGNGRYFYRDSAGMPVSLDGEESFRTGNTEMHFQFSLDLLKNKKYDSFLIYANLGLGYWTRHDRYKEVLEDSPDIINNSFSRTRYGLVPLFGIGLKWEEYISPHWGYFFDLFYLPEIMFSPVSVLMEDQITNRTSKPDQRLNNGLLTGELEENLRHRQFRLGLGLSFRF